MPEQTPACDLSGIREAVCIHTKKITDACRDKDCVEDLRVYLTRDSQAILDRAASAKARCVELIHVDMDVTSVPYNNGFYTLDLTFYYKVVADVTVCGTRPVTVYGLAVFSKRAMLFGGDGSAKVFTSQSCACRGGTTGAPQAVVEVVDPMILASSAVDSCNCCCSCGDLPELPQCVMACFDDELVLSGECRKLLVTIGQFSIIRLERDTQLLIPAFDYCIPTKACAEGGAVGGAESPCDIFGRIEFPVDAFYPSRNEPCIQPSESCTGCYRTTNR